MSLTKTPTSDSPPEPPSFHPFSGLPTELRLKIWKHALPPPLGRLILPYRKHFWLRRELPPAPGESSAFEYSVAIDPAPLEIRFAHGVAQANHEAAAAAQKWAANQPGIKPKDGLTLHHYERPFSPERDVIYLERQPWATYPHGPVWAQMQQK
ncbi:hypothetical protein K461DRAFT_282959 [Myriangium duriaei CBS 260.36]|uniref:2EXR domain-containing protein n=1 Tax=Myriangium duriaei CBS 260.36 TaxID=1168546 RepID=A0A9P4MG18_9PEZI|nr:hypothetical protein K461DRAFT_282959 [Myriangium duriaei CBS 260.36]